jgi:hypothetical protein
MGMSASSRVRGAVRGADDRAAVPLAPAAASRDDQASIQREQQETLDADYTVVEDNGAALLSARPRGTHGTRGHGASVPPRGLALVARARSSRGTSMQMAALRSYAPYHAYLGVLVDVWA